MVCAFASVVPMNSTTEASPATTAATGPPDAYWLLLWGYTYNSDGVTPLTGCSIMITDVRTGESVVTTSDPDYGFYQFDLAVLPSGWIIGDPVNVTATKGTEIGWSEAPIAFDPWPYMQMDVTLSAPSSSFVLQLFPGWNLVCMPFINLDYTAGTLGLGFGDVVATCNSSTRQYDEVFIVGYSPMGMDFAIKPSTGYEIFVSAPRNLTLFGTLPPTETRLIEVPAGGGWVELGLASLTPRHASEIPAMYDGGTLIIISKWDPIRQVFYSYIPGVPPTDFVIYPGEGFWAWATASGTFSYQP